MSCASIDRFIAECRERSRVRPQFTAAHISSIEASLVAAQRAAEESPKCFGTMWSCIETAITRTDWDVRAKIDELKLIGDTFGAEFRKYVPPQSASAH